MRSQFDPQADVLEPDDAPTITVDLPDDMSFSDFDPGEPSTPLDAEKATEGAAPAVRFDPEVDSAVDDDGIPIWEDPA